MRESEVEGYEAVVFGPERDIDDWVREDYKV
jgi:hypothetical protein